ncbi:MAG: thiamine diphosphokinase [Candidatus Bipolaricaulia bacterium]
MVRSILILGNGPWRGVEFLGELVAQADYIIAADGGFSRARRLGLKVDLVVGDLDSLGPEGRAELEASGIKTIIHPREKDQTDLELALEEALALKPRKIVLFGTLGARLDQSLANIFILERAARLGIDAEILSGRERIYLVHDRLELADGEVGDLVSLLPLTDEAEGVRTWGLAYPLCEESLSRASSRGISNRIISLPAGVALQAGLLLLIHRRWYNQAEIGELG